MKKILIVEDDPGVLRLLEKKLSRIGYEVHSAALGESAISACQNTQIDLMLLDYRLPDMSSENIIETLLSLSSCPPFMIMTGFGDEAIAVDMMKLGAEDYLVKDSNFYNNIPAVLQKVMVNVENRNRLKDADQKIRQQASLLNIAQDAIIVINADESISFWNPASEKVFGFSEKEALGSPIRKLLLPNGEMKTFSLQWKELLEQDLWNGELTLNTKNGNIVTVSSKNTLVRDKYGEPDYILSINTDITEKKKLELHLERVRKMETVGRLAGGLAHDFNNALASIFGYAQLAQRATKDNPKAHKDLENVIHAAQKAKCLVEQILTFSRNNPVTYKNINPLHVLNETVELLQTSIDPKVSIEVHCIEQVPLINADATQMHQVFMNLILNASHAMREKGGIVHIDLSTTAKIAVNLETEMDKNAQRLRIRVSDTGCGMSDETRSQLFEPFYTTKAEGEGTGIGLAVVHTIISQHQGTINVNSEIGRGSVFEILLPTTKLTDQKIEVSELDLRQHTFLIVDDNEAVRDSTKSILQDHGLTVHEAADGLEALEILDEKEFSVVISDENMPGLKGSRLAQIVNNESHKIPFIIVTAYADEISDEKKDSAYIYEILKKPYNPEELLEIIKAAISKRVKQ